MAIKHLGESIDINAGGQDLQFRPHEKEIAQSEILANKTKQIPETTYTVIDSDAN